MNVGANDMDFKSSTGLVSFIICNGYMISVVLKGEGRGDRSGLFRTYPVPSD